MYSQDMVLCRLIGAVPAVSVMHSGRCAVTVGLEPSDRRRSYADPPRHRLRMHCGSARLGSPAACAQYTVIRHTALETGSLTVVSAYLPRVSVSRPYFDLGTLSPPTRI
jgi:hypothetical protein